MAGLLDEEPKPAGNGLLDYLSQVLDGIKTRQDEYNAKQSGPLAESVAQGNLAPWLAFYNENGPNPMAVNLGMSAAPIKAFHGSPYDFNAFSLSKVGTGEGAQAYGHGLYFAENENVAKAYRDALKPGRGASPADTAARVLDAVGGDREKALAEMTRRIDLSNRRGGDYAGVRHLMDAKNIINLSPETASGRMYEVQINAEPQQFLDWDAPLKAQPNARAALKALPPQQSLEAGADWLGRSWLDQRPGSSVWHGAANGRTPAEAAEFLNRAGIPGIKYLDQGSRGAAEGTSNYVVFDPNIIQILRKYGIAGPAVGAGLLGDDNTEE